MTEIGWGKLQPFEAYGRAGDNLEDFEIIPYLEAKSDVFSSYKHASHAMIFARKDDILWELYSQKASILMQMRFDGLLGFPGGLVDPGENPLQGVNRELEEEIGLDLKRHILTEKDHITSFLNRKKNLVLHFYGKEVSVDEFKEIELGNLKAPDYGVETLGIVQPPLYTMGDGYRGLPAFLSNSYAGNARQELLIGLQHCNILTKDEIHKAVDSWKTFVKDNSNSSGLTKLNS